MNLYILLVPQDTFEGALYFSYISSLLIRQFEWRHRIANLTRDITTGFFWVRAAASPARWLPVWLGALDPRKLGATRASSLDKKATRHIELTCL